MATQSDELNLPIITVAQLNRRGACLDEIVKFRARYGEQTIVTVAKAAEVHDQFDFGWASYNLLFEEHAKLVWERVLARCRPPKGDKWPDGDITLTQAFAEEFARVYVEVYPCVP